MDFVSKLFPELDFARLIAEAIFLSLLAIFLLIVFIVSAAGIAGATSTASTNAHSPCGRSGTAFSPVPSRALVAAEAPRLRDVESILLDNIEMAVPAAAGFISMPSYQADFLTCVFSRHEPRGLEARRRPGRAPAVPVLPSCPRVIRSARRARGGDRIAAVRGLGRIGLREAAPSHCRSPARRRPRGPEHAVKKRLVNCCRDSPRLSCAT